MRYFFMLSLLLLPLLSGCQQVPSELRNLKPVTINVLNDGRPVEGVLVSLTNKDVQGVQGSSALTDLQGNAVIATTIRTSIAKGAAPGTYIVSFGKVPELPADLVPIDTEQELPGNIRADRQKKREDIWEKNRIVPKNLETHRTSPVELLVDEKTGAKLTVDLAKY